MFDDDHDTSGNTTPPELSEDVQALINNGLDFLDLARAELEASKLKFSVVSFWTAVEILLKVPLVHEHWSLVCSKKNTPKKQDYRDGDFQSVTYEETRRLLQDVLEKPLTPETHLAFEKVRKHRNRVVHFYHPAFTPKEQHLIQKEQADAWFALNRLMRDEWQTIFGARHTWKLAYGETRLLRGSEFYAAVRLKQVQSELDELIEMKIPVETCPDCGQKAMVTGTETTGSEDTTLFVSRCKVCSSTSRYVSFICPNCEERQSISEGDEAFSCEECKHPEERFELLNDERFMSIDEQLMSVLPAGCTHCMIPDSVCKHGDGYLCTQCLTFYKELEVCGCCDHWSDSVSELSRFKGCEFCDGDSRYLDD